MTNGAWPYEGPPGIFWTEVVEPDGEVTITPVQPTPPGGEPYLAQDTYAEIAQAGYSDPPFNQELDLQAVESGIFDVKPEGFVWHWEGPWIPDVERLGPPMRTPIAGGHAAAVVFDPTVEFGEGVEPAFVYAPYEVYENPNEYFRMGRDWRAGGKPLGDANPQAVLYEDIQDQAPTAYQLSWRGYRNYGGGRHTVVVPIPKIGSVTGNLAAVPNVTSLDNLLPETTDVY